MSFGSATGLSAGGDPFGGATGFGFDIPQGDPGAVSAAARAVSEVARALERQAQALHTGAAVALESDGGWQGSASSSFATLASHVGGVFVSNGAACTEVAGALSTFADELTTAQTVTRQALADCERYHGEMVNQQTAASTAASEARTATASASSAPHPAVAESFRTAAGLADGRAQAASRAAGAAQLELEAAQRRGRLAFERYQHEVTAINGRLTAAAGALRQAPQAPGGAAPVPLTVSGSDARTASELMAAAGGLAGATRALSEPGGLEALACGPVSPAVALAFLGNTQRLAYFARLREEDQPVDGSLGGVLGPPGEVLQGAWNTTKGTGELLWSGLNHPDEIPGAVAGFIAQSAEHPVAFAKQAIDWNDWSHGRGFQAVGSLLAGVLEAKGLGKVAGATRNVLARGASGEEGAAGAAGGGSASPHPRVNPEIRPDLTTFTGQVLEHLGVPHASDMAEGIAPLTSHSRGELGAAARVIAEDQLVGQMPAQITKDILAAASQTPQLPDIIVAPKAQRPAPIRTPNPPVRLVRRGR